MRRLVHCSIGLVRDVQSLLQGGWLVSPRVGLDGRLQPLQELVDAVFLRLIRQLHDKLFEGVDVAAHATMLPQVATNWCTCP